MSRDFSILRGIRVGDYFSSWSAYISSYAQDTPRTLNGAIRRINRENRGLRDDPRTLPGLAMGETIARHRSAPWPTFVLGSGCLSVDEDVTEAGEVGTLLRAALADVPAPAQLRSQTMEFVENLALDRTGHALASAGLVSPSGRTRAHAEWVFAADVAIAANLITRLYGETLARTRQIISEAHREEVIIAERQGSWIAVYDDLISPLKDALNRIDRAGEPQGWSARGSLQSLASSIVHAVEDEKHVHRTHVELLTAFSWFFLTEGTTIYPDWSDLLLFEAFVDADVADYAAKPPAWDDSRWRPRRTPINAADPVALWLTGRLRTIAEDSWRKRAAGSTASKRREFYDAIAGLLGQQADNYHSFDDGFNLGSPHRPPLPTCFITTFDLELELAMWQRSIEASEPRPFVIVLPIVIAGPRKDDDNVALRWAWRQVTPSADEDALASLCDGGPEAWTLLGDSLPPALINDPVGWGRTPIIVRLAGSPLMKVALNDVESARQALLLDEYTALSQTVLDLTEAAQSSSGNAAGLPEDLTRSNLSPDGAYMPRYWMYLGVQLSDAGVKSRLLASQITAAQSDVAAKVRSTLAGVAINQRSRAADRDMFHWYGIDVVQDYVIQGDAVGSVSRSVTRDLRMLCEELDSNFNEVRAEIDNAAAGGMRA